MTTPEAMELFEYGSWANGRTFAAAEVLTREQLEAPVASSFPSVLASLAHIVGAEWIWLRRWQGESPVTAPAWAGGSALAGLRAELATLESQRAAFLAPLADADLARAVTYRGLDGAAFSHPLGQLVRHVVNHSTYHRGQVATQLRQLGRTPPNTDYTRFLREGR